MDQMQPGDQITIQILATNRKGTATLIRIEHKRDGLTLTPPTASEVYHRVLEPARPWSKSIAGLPDTN
jgi:hypothetical protein